MSPTHCLNKNQCLPSLLVLPWNRPPVSHGLPSPAGAYRWERCAAARGSCWDYFSTRCAVIFFSLIFNLLCVCTTLSVTTWPSLPHSFVEIGALFVFFFPNKVVKVAVSWFAGGKATLAILKLGDRSWGGGTKSNQGLWNLRKLNLKVICTTEMIKTGEKNLNCFNVVLIKLKAAYFVVGVGAQWWQNFPSSNGGQGHQHQMER